MITITSSHEGASPKRMKMDTGPIPSRKEIDLKFRISGATEPAVPALSLTKPQSHEEASDLCVLVSLC